MRDRLDGKAQARGKAHGTQHAQRILRKAAARVSHRADDARGKVVPPAERVKQAALGVVGHGVDGKVAPLQVFGDVGDEAHAVGMAVVGIGALLAEGGDLHGLAVHHSGDGAMGGASLVHGNAQLAQGGARLLPVGRRADVNVVRGRAAQRVAHPAAYHPGLKPGFLERLEHAQTVGGNVIR